MTPSKILYLNHVAYLGGAEIALLDLLRGLNRNLYEPAILVPEGPLSNEIGRLGDCVSRMPLLPGLNRYTFLRFISLLPSLLSLVKREAPDLIHANTNCTSLYSGILSRVLHIPTVGQIRDMEPLGRMGRLFLRQNTRVIAISEAVTHYLIHHGIPVQQIALVRDGVDLTQYPLKTRHTGSPRKGKPLIAAIIGQIGARKGHLFLLEAVNMLVKTYPYLRLWIVGKEPAHSQEHYTERIRRFIAQHRLDTVVHLWGFRSDIPNILDRIDVLILPSLQEPFGKIVIEAMAMGKAVIASRVGGVPEIVRDKETGLLVPPQDSQAIRQALEQLLMNPGELTHMGQAGRKRVEQYFRIERTVQSTEQLYKHIFSN